MEKLTVVYAASRNLYQYLPMAVGSLLKHNPTAKVYIFCEDDKIETINHPNITILNTNNFPSYVPDDSPNANTIFTKFTLIRCYLAEWLKEDQILWLDVDTLVTAPITELAELQLNNYLIAGVIDWGYLNNFRRDQEPKKYVNAGVLLMNLKLMRKENTTKKLVEVLQGEKLPFPDQDALNQVCYPRIKTLPIWYNYTGFYLNQNPLFEPKIFHFAGGKMWDVPIIKLWREYYRSELNDKN